MPFPVKLRIQVKRLRPDALLPTRGSDYAAGYDLRACLDTPAVIPPHSTAMIGTGLSFALPEGWFGAIFARSGLAVRQSLRPANCVGVCDCDYRGEYIIPLRNDGDVPQTVAPGDRVAQLVLLPCPDLEFQETDSLPETGRGVNGFGSTGR